MAAATNGESSDPWDWPQMLYCARVRLKIASEEDFWRMRPRTFFALLSIATSANAAANGQNTDAGGDCFIDQIPGFI